jgi:hypothetical protein
MMTLLERAFAVARELPDEMQDEAARAVLSYLGHELPEFELTPEDTDAVSRSREAFSQGDIATDEQVRAIWAKHGL